MLGIRKIIVNKSGTTLERGDLSYQNGVNEEDGKEDRRQGRGADPKKGGKN